MTFLGIPRAGKDEEYRLSLSEAERALLPDSPAELSELRDQLASVLLPRRSRGLQSGAPEATSGSR